MYPWRKALVQWSAKRRGAWTLIVVGAVITAIGIPWFLSYCFADYSMTYLPLFMMSAAFLGLGIAGFGSGIYYASRVGKTRS